MAIPVIGPLVSKVGLGVKSVWDWIQFIYNILTKAPEIISIIEAIGEFIESLTGDSGKDEVEDIKKVKLEAQKLQKVVFKRMKNRKPKDLVEAGRA